MSAGGSDRGTASVVAAAASRAGPAREHNEDSHLIDAEAAVFLVADGMGGHAAGEVASAMATEQVHGAWTRPATRHRAAAFAALRDTAERRALFQAVREGVMDAHLGIAEEAQRDEGKHGMGTTLTGLLVAGGEAIFAHAGDSRAYLVRDGRAAQLSEDHNILSRLRAAGMEAREKWRGVLTSALGIGTIARVDTFAVPLVAGDRVVLCTDGVHGHLTEAELAEAASGDPEQAAAALVELPHGRGGIDDATAIVVNIVRSGRGPAWEAAVAAQREADALAASALFEALSEPERLRALRIAAPRALAAGDALEPSASGDRVAYVVLTGDVALPGGERLAAGNLVYAGALIEGAPPPRDAARAEGAALVLAIRRGDFLELSEEEPDLGVKLYAALARLLARY